MEPGEGTEGQVHVGPMKQEPTRAGRTRQQGREVTLAGQRRSEVDSGWSAEA